MNGTAGPYEEGDTPSLTCRVTGGEYATARGKDCAEKEVIIRCLARKGAEVILDQPTFYRGLSEKLHVRKNALQCGGGGEGCGKARRGGSSVSLLEKAGE